MLSNTPYTPRVFGKRVRKFAENKGLRVQEVRKSPQNDEKTLFRCGIAQESWDGADIGADGCRERCDGAAIMPNFTT